MIEYVEVEDFERHRRKRVEFDPKVTVISGPNSLGKSAVLRAVRAAALNRWRPGYVRIGAAGLRVTLGVDGEKLVATRGKGKNALRLGKAVYKASRTRKGDVVPPAVARLLRLGEENFQTQGDVHFWFALPPGQVVTRLNDIVDLSLIDRAVTKAKANAGAAARRVEFGRERLKSARKEVKRLGWAPALAAALARLDGLAERWARARRAADRLSRGLTAAREGTRRAESLQNLAVLGRSAVKAGERADKARRALAGLESALKSIARLDRDLKVRVPDIEPLERVRAAGDAAAERWREIDQKYHDWVAAEDRAKAARRELAAAESGRCPTCGQKTK